MSHLDWICVTVCSKILPGLGLAAKKMALGKHCGWCLSVVSNQYCTNHKCMKVRYSKTSLARHQNYNHTHWLAASNPCRGPWTSDTSVWKSSYNTYKKKASGHFVYTSFTISSCWLEGLLSAPACGIVEFLIARSMLTHHKLPIICLC